MSPNIGAKSSTLGMESVISELLEAWNSHDIERIEALHAPKYEGIDVAQAGPCRGARGIHLSAASYLRAFPDLRLSREEIIIQDNRVAVIWTVRGTHEGKLMGIPPTGRKVSVRGASLLEVEEGKISRGLHIWDVAGLLRAMRLLPAL